MNVKINMSMKMILENGMQIWLWNIYAFLPCFKTMWGNEVKWKSEMGGCILKSQTVLKSLITNKY